MRRVRLVLLCEDSQHESFAVRFLKSMGWDKRWMRIEKSPAAEGAAEQWVRQRFPRELQACRKRNTKAETALLTMIDGDLYEPSQRHKVLESECAAQDIAFREARDPVAIVVPCRNVETWIRYLSGEQVDEQTIYPKLAQERGCRESVKNLVRICKTSGLPDDAPPALHLACREYERISRVFSV